MLESNQSFNVKTVRSGQQGRYQDTVNEYIVSSLEEQEAVKEYCTSKLHPCKTEKQNTKTPFDTYYEFWKTAPNTYRYMVTTPYCD